MAMDKGRGRQDARGRSLLKRKEEKVGYCSRIALSCEKENKSKRDDVCVGDDALLPVAEF